MTCVKFQRNPFYFSTVNLQYHFKQKLALPLISFVSNASPLDIVSQRNFLVFKRTIDNSVDTLFQEYKKGRRKNSVKTSDTHLLYFRLFFCLKLETPKSKYKHQTWLAYV